MLGLSLTTLLVLLLIGVPVAHMILGAAAVGILGAGNDASIIVQQLYMGLDNFTMLAVPFFIISGDIAARGDTSQKIINFINAVLGHLNGGLGIATIFACAFFGAISGSAIATVVAIGALMLPKLLEAGYPKGLSLGIITTAGTLGVMIPPSIPMLQVCVAMQTAASDQFIAGIVPGLLTAFAMSVYVFCAAKRAKLPKTPRKSLREIWAVFRDSFWSLMYPVLVLGSIYGGISTPSEAAVLSLWYVIFLELFIYKKMTLKKMIFDIAHSAVGAAALALMIATAQTFVWYLTSARVPDMLFDFTIGFIDSRAMMLTAICILFFVVGMFTYVTDVVMILGPLLRPLLLHFNIDLYQFGVLIVMLAQLGFVSPPFGICLFVTMKVGNASMAEVVKGSLPFLVVMGIITVLLAAFEGISTCLL